MIKMSNRNVSKTVQIRLKRSFWLLNKTIINFFSAGLTKNNWALPLAAMLAATMLTVFSEYAFCAHQSLPTLWLLLTFWYVALTTKPVLSSLLSDRFEKCIFDQLLWHRRRFDGQRTCHKCHTAHSDVITKIYDTSVGKKCQKSDPCT